MNDKIKELLEKAGFGLWTDEDWNPGDIVDWSARYDDEMNRFVQLLVDECVSIASDETDPIRMAEKIKAQFLTS